MASHFASDVEIPWWHSPAGITGHANELGIEQGEAEDFGEFKARVMAASGPGPWEDEQPALVRERIEHYRAVGSAAQ